MEKAYATYTAVLDKIEENAEGVAETINDLADLLTKAKNFAKNYKGGKTEAAKAKAYEENIKKAQALLIKNPDVPDSLKTALTASQATAQAAWDFYKTGQPCTVSGNSGGVDAFFRLLLADCGTFTASIDAEALAIEKASGSLACNCSPIISYCSPIENILNQIKNGNNSNQTKINVAKVDNKERLSNETDWVSAINGIDIVGKCFKIALNFKFNGDKIDLNPKKYKETTSGFDLIDDKGTTLLSINLLGETGQAKFYKQAILKKHLGFEEKEKEEIFTIKVYASGKIVKYVPKKIQEDYKK